MTLSESSGAPIDLLYQLIKERDGSLQDIKADSSLAGAAPLKKTSQSESRTHSEPEDGGTSYKAASRVMTTPQKNYQGSPARLKESAGGAELSPPPSGPRLVESRTSEGSSSTLMEHQSPTKPLWAPLETDAPITLGKLDKHFE